jgi:glycosyltransferase involved in cell wall biosynthesis
MPGYRSTRRYSSAVIAGSQHTLSELEGFSTQTPFYIPENGVDPEKFKNPRSHNAALPIKAVFLGRLVPYKGVDMLLEAAADFLKLGSLELDIIGDGPESPHLHKTVLEQHLPNVRFHGWVQHSEVPSRLRQYDVLLLPSIREFGGGVVIEAMALGLMPIVADYGGPAELVSPQTGIKISFTDRKSLVDGLKQAIGLLTKTPSLIDALGAAARLKVLQELTWDAKTQKICSIYETVLNSSLQPVQP